MEENGEKGPGALSRLFNILSPANQRMFIGGVATLALGCVAAVAVANTDAGILTSLANDLLGHLHWKNVMFQVIYAGAASAVGASAVAAYDKFKTNAAPEPNI